MRLDGLILYYALFIKLFLGNFKCKRSTSLTKDYFAFSSLAEKSPSILSINQVPSPNAGIVIPLLKI